MNKLFIIFTSVALLLLSSCEKMSEEDSTSAKGCKNLVFNSFVAQQVGSYSTRATIGGGISKLDFVMFSLDGSTSSVYKSIQQDSTSTDFGTIQLDEIPYGTYIIVAVGSNCSVHSTITSPTSVDFGGKVADTFLYYDTLTVSATTETNQSIELNRITSKFSLKLLDTQPTNVSSIEFLVSTGGGTSFDPSTGLAQASTDVRTVTMNISTFSGKSNAIYSFNTYLPQSESNISVVANMKDSSGNILYTKTFDSVNMKINRQTIYSGYFYTHSSVMSIGLNSQWENEYDYTFK